jgi:formyltetrahydrofolate-dependent phosphoribosylglycinamide formyltransferase
MPDSRLPIAVLVSGSGTNLQALIEAAAEPGYAATIAVVVSDRPGIMALQRAEAAGIATEVVAWDDDRERSTEATCEVAARHGARALVLAGFMRILAPLALDRFPGAIVNTHPALLPSFPGAHAVAGAIAHGVKLSGVTIHFVDEEVDHGPIIAQEAVAVGPDDDETALQARIQQVEHRLFPQVVDALARGAITVDGRIVRWEGR